MALHGGTGHFSSQTSDHVGIGPPVRRRTPPLAILIESEAKTQPPREAPQVNTVRCISTPGLVPPVSRKPMGSLAAASTDVSIQPPQAQKATDNRFWDPNSDAPGLDPPVTKNTVSTPLTSTSAEAVADQARTNESAPITMEETTPHGVYDVLRPTCSLNLVCYRGGSQGCILRQVQTALASRFSSDEAFHTAIKKNPQLITSDEAFFCELRRLYRDMSGLWRRSLSLKTLRGLRILAVREFGLQLHMM
jgi:hypothetical protein